MFSEYFENVEQARAQIDRKIGFLKQVLEKRKLELNWKLDTINSGISTQTKIAKIRIEWTDKEVCALIKSLGNIEMETIQDKRTNESTKKDSLFRFWGINKVKNEPIKEPDYMTMKPPKKRSKSETDLATKQSPVGIENEDRTDSPVSIDLDVDEYKAMRPVNNKPVIKRSISTRDIDTYKTYQEDMRKSFDFTDVDENILSPILERKESKWKSQELLCDPIYDVIDEKWFERERKLGGTLGAKKKRDIKKSATVFDLPIIAKCTQGKRLGQLDKPKGVAVSPNGRIFVAEKGNNRIQVFTSEAKYISSFGEKSGPNKMQGPYGIFVRNDTVYVTLTNQHAIQMYTAEGVFVKQKGREGREDGKLKLPTGIDGDKTRGKVFVCDTGNNRIQIFDKELKFIKVARTIQLDRPLDVKVVRYGDFYVLDRSQSCVHLFNCLGELLSEIIDSKYYLKLLNPLYLTISPEDYIILSDYSNHCIHLFSSHGELMWTLGDAGKGKPLEEPRGLACDSYGRLITVCNKKKDALQIFHI